MQSITKLLDPSSAPFDGQRRQTPLQRNSSSGGVPLGTRKLELARQLATTALPRGAAY